MAIVLGPNQYGKAETHVVRVFRDTARHELRDLTVSTALRGDFGAAHVEGDQGSVLPTDSQKNTVFSFAKEGVGAIEEFALTLAGHFLEEVRVAEGGRVEISEAPWQRIRVDGTGHDHAFVQRHRHQDHGRQRRRRWRSCRLGHPRPRRTEVDRVGVPRWSSSGSTPVTSASPGVASPPCSSPCRPSGRRRVSEASRSPTSSVDVRGASRPDRAALEGRIAVTPYAGRSLTGVVRSTWLRGSRVDVDGSLRGRLLAASG
ncbi:MAG TPA: hypothetical protein VFG72_03835 [Marmoricola sp.]|nr:hypothetical protein [Marmoricola sp.]